MKLTFRTGLLSLLLAGSLASTSSLLTACRNDVVCMAPPPNLSLLLSNPPTAVDQNKISIYSYQKGIKVPAQYLRFTQQSADNTNGTPLLVTADELIQGAPKADSAQFYLEYNGQLVGRLRLETVKNTHRCNGWQQLTKLTYNRQEITPVNFAYSIILRP